MEGVQQQEDNSENGGYTEEEVRAAEEAISKQGTFNLAKLIRLKQSVISGFQNGKVPVADYAEMLHEWTRLFKHLGKALVLAF